MEKTGTGPPAGSCSSSLAVSAAGVSALGSKSHPDDAYFSYSCICTERN